MCLNIDFTYTPARDRVNLFYCFVKGGALGRNHKRVMDVWMDEYKENIYIRRPHYRNIDPGNFFVR